MSNAEDLNRLTACSLVLLGHIFYVLGNHRVGVQVRTGTHGQTLGTGRGRRSEAPGARALPRVVARFPFHGVTPTHVTRSSAVDRGPCGVGPEGRGRAVRAGPSPAPQSPPTGCPPPAGK